jgi:hypothetical protein
MRRLEKLFTEQKGVCPWCGYTMIMVTPGISVSGNVDAAATIDHLMPHLEMKRNATRFVVAAHRKCNNSRGHSVEIREEIKREMIKSASYMGLTKNMTMANHIWCQKILQAFRVAGIEPLSPFRKAK